MGSMQRNKGANAEREFVKILQPVVDRVFGSGQVMMARNLMQTRDGGFDIAGLEWLALEIKRQETLSLAAWWEQAVRQAGEDRVPVLAYRQNGKKWRVRMQVQLHGVVALAELSLDDWLEIFEQQLMEYHQDG